MANGDATAVNQDASLVEWAVAKLFNGYGLSGVLAVFLLLVLLGLIPTPTTTGNQAAVREIEAQHESMLKELDAAAGQSVQEERDRRMMMQTLRAICIHAAKDDQEKDDCLRADP